MMESTMTGEIIAIHNDNDGNDNDRGERRLPCEMIAIDNGYDGNTDDHGGDDLDDDHDDAEKEHPCLPLTSLPWGCQSPPRPLQCFPTH